MSRYLIERGEDGVYKKTLAAGEIDEIVFANRPLAIELISNGDGRINLTTDGSDPVVDGGSTKVIPDFPGVRVINIPPSSTDEELVVKLISDSSPVYDLSRCQVKS